MSRSNAPDTTFVNTSAHWTHIRFVSPPLPVWQPCRYPNLAIHLLPCLDRANSRMASSPKKTKSLESWIWDDAYCIPATKEPWGRDGLFNSFALAKPQGKASSETPSASLVHELTPPQAHFSNHPHPNGRVYPSGLLWKGLQNQ